MKFDVVSLATWAMTCYVCGGYVAMSENNTAAVSEREELKFGSGKVPLPAIRSQDGVLGADVSQLTSATAFDCLKQKGYQYAIVRAHRSFGAVDTNAPATIANAWAAGLTRVDVYLFPCFRCGNAKSQVKNTVGHLNAQKSDYGMIWIDVEQHDWSSNKSANQEFFLELYETARALKSTGVYTSYSQWSQIMGADFTGGASASLWYPHFDQNPSFSDFKPFGGWSEPSIKQFQATIKECGAIIDKNWCP